MTTAVAPQLIAWYRGHGRDLPWRRDREPYHIWLSEIMLQQTGAAAVIPYYERFLARFPDVAALAAAPLDDVLALWAGLGYYARARHLHAAAQQLAARGGFPEEAAELAALPGIGRSTANAIAALAFDRPAAILDGNVRRILCRLFALEAPPHTAASEHRLWQWAGELLPRRDIHNYTQAIMDLGATVCTPRHPRCEVCPLSCRCQAHQLGRVAEFPFPTVKKALPTVSQAALWLEYQGRILLQKRPYEGFLGGLWEFPNIVPAPRESAMSAAARLLMQLGWAGTLHQQGTIRHGYSHFRLNAEIFSAVVRPALSNRVAETTTTSRWLPAAGLADLPLHGAHRKIAVLQTAKNPTRKVLL